MSLFFPESGIIIWKERAVRIKHGNSKLKVNFSWNPSGLIYFLGCLLFWGIMLEVAAVEVRSARWEDKGDFLRLTISLSQNVKNNIRNEINSKGYFYVDLSGVSRGFKKFPSPPGDRGILQIRSQYFPSHNLQRFLIYVRKDTKFEVSTLVTPPRLVVDIAPNNQSLSRQTNRKKIVIIDPGHGGVSTGARSRSKVNGKYVWEKDIVLRVAKRLEQLINQSTNMQAYLTRRSDTYVALNDRRSFAVQAGGDVFVSLHCNSIPGTKPGKARGLEIFTWNEKSSADAALRYLESLENDSEVSLKVKGRNDPALRQMLGTMMGERLAQQEALSELLAQKTYGSMLKLSYYKSYHRGIKRARFKVLENYEMPSILIELGFMSNPRELKYLVGRKFQDQQTRAIYNGLNYYFQRCDTMFQPSYRTLAKSK
jgi:N-acetylmuramoyl-L-alanine amidase